MAPVRPKISHLHCLSTASRLAAAAFLINLCLFALPAYALDQRLEPAATNVPHAAPKVSWSQIAPDLEMAEYSDDDSLLSVPLVLVRTSLKRFHLRAIRAAEFGAARSEVRALCRTARASVCINASFFDESGDPLGLVVSRGITHHGVHQQGRTLTGVLQVTRQGVDILPRQNYTGIAVLEAIQAGPRLVLSGVPTTGLKDTSRTGRSAVCKDAKGRIIFASSGASFRGLTFPELQRALVHPDIACASALNLDGGGSAQMFIAPRFIAPQSADSPSSTVVIAMNGFDPVPVALALVDE